MQAAPTDAISYNRDIRPILSDRCFACHGPDAGTRQADLRLDTQEGAHLWAIMPGDPEGSEVFNRIRTDDPDIQMPPRAAKKPRLTPEEVELIRKWIEQGAEYETHWAYIPPQRCEPPAVKG